MKRLTRADVCRELGRSKSRVLEQLIEGYFRSALQDGPRSGWTVAECCVKAELGTEHPCPVCIGAEPAPEPLDATTPDLGDDVDEVLARAEESVTAAAEALRRVRGKLIKSRRNDRPPSTARSTA